VRHDRLFGIFLKTLEAFLVVESQAVMRLTALRFQRFQYAGQELGEFDVFLVSWTIGAARIRFKKVDKNNRLIYDNIL
jgi:hypothetical protein